MGYGQVNVGSSKQKILGVAEKFITKSRTYTEVVENQGNGIKYLITAGAYVWGDANGNVYIEGSNDNSTWTEIDKIQAYSNTTAIKVNTNNNYKYYRLSGNVVRTPSEQYGNQMTAGGSIYTL